jgi:tetratricopeptide (TPR) repeat protein
LARARISLDDLPRAEQALKDWRAKVPSPKAEYDQIEGELALKKQDAPRAVKALKRCAERMPKDASVWQLLATAYATEKDFADGIEAIGHALAIHPDAPSFIQRAQLRIRAHDWAGAESDVRQANQLDAQVGGIQRLLPAFERNAEWRPTMNRLDQRVQKEPRNYQVLLDRAEWLRWAGFTPAARDDINAALALNPKSLRARFWSGLAAQEQHAEKDRESNGEERNAKWAEKDAAQGVMPMSSKLIEAKFEEGLTAMDSEKDTETRALFLLKYQQPLLALREAGETDGSPARAQALLDLGRLPEAGRAAREATARHPESAIAWLALARWELETGNYREALDAEKRSAKLHKTPEAEEVRKLAQQRLGKP